MTTQRGTKHVPRLNKERLQNEAAALRFIHCVCPEIPVPRFYRALEVDGMITEYVTGVGMTGLSKGEKKVVTEELLRYVDMLHRIKSKTTGSPDPEVEGPVIPPYRAMAADDRKYTWPRKTSDKEEYVFCHNDLSQANVIVDAKILKIKAIVDWEYAGFWPEWFEMRIWERVGRSVAPERFGRGIMGRRCLSFLIASLKYTP
ncbi:hypothetical protein SI65_01648 [Aspergillus cristatus]|uniref:Aminoglycoside phosphotransferase domain-containing protein n=1 Tax=Aspergillus cristatus TaxID=573508 RepID=A0A1E3BSX6_ASPCR|nr:hypothetical protein SI65_01648 [Aspergillus cristatus]